ncbi:MAG: MATE family efflux transporter [Gammaproteobacteria bacterium]|nr:MATE family efflux transporter [Gammaproteobacteria bacterium]
MPSPALLHHRPILRLALPLMLSNLSIPLLGLVDTAVVGHLEHAYYLGAVALGALIFSFLFWGFGFLRMGTTGLIAQAFGEENNHEIHATLVRASLLALLFSLLILLLQYPIGQLAFYLLDGSHPVEHYAQQYFTLRIWSAPATLLNYVLIGWMLGMQNVRGPLVMLLVTNLTNIVLDLWFVVGLGMTVDGVAIASVIAEYIGCAVGIVLTFQLLKQHPAQWQWEQILKRHKLRQLVTLNSNIMLRTLCLIFTLAFFTAQGAKMGDLILAANAILINFQTLMAYALDGFAHAAEALVGRAIGKCDRRALKRAIYTAAFWSLGFALLFVAFYALAGQWMIDQLSDIEAVRSVANEYLIWSIFMPLVAVWGYLFDGIFIGATRAREMRNTMLASTLLVFFPAWWLLQPWGNHGLWAALMLFMVARGAAMAWSFRRLTRRGVIPL